MGSVVSVWSSTKKTGKTVFLYMLTKQFVSILSKNTKILVICLNLSYGNLMKLFNVDANELNIEDVVNLRLNPNSQFNILNALAKKDNVYFLGSRKTNSTYANRNMRTFENLVEEFRQEFDLVLIDTISGGENALINMVLSKSDHVINIINQDMEFLEDPKLVNGKELAFVVNKYKDIYPDMKDIASMQKIKNIFKVPECNLLQEMKNKGKLEFYTQHSDTEYNLAFKEIVDFIAKSLELEVEKVTGQERRRKGFFNILGGFKA